VLLQKGGRLDITTMQCANEAVVTRPVSQGEQMRKRAYATPVLLCYGPVETTTMGPTPGTGESGNAGTRRGPGGGGGGGLG
jgi:hypothetical protein